MGFTRRRSDRPDQARFRLGSNLEHLESRALLATSSSFHSFYTPSDLPPRTISHGSPPIRINHPIGSGDRQLSFLDNDGKVVTGKDRAGNEYTITVHGPGVVIVTDATPNDGILDDDIDTIQLVGTSLTDTYVTGQVLSSFKVQTDGTTQFNRLLNVEGVASIILNGFTLAQTVAPPVGTLNNVEHGHLPRRGGRDPPVPQHRGADRPGDGRPADQHRHRRPRRESSRGSASTASSTPSSTPATATSPPIPR